jgi:lipopolysaccharide export system protein LptA
MQDVRRQPTHTPMPISAGLNRLYRSDVRRKHDALPAWLVTGLAVSVLLGLCISTPVAALKEDENQPLYIESDAAELDDKQSISLYIGNVEVQQGSMHITADEVLVHHKPNRQPQKIIAVGNPVRYRQLLDDNPKEVKGHAQRMEYDADRDEITLIDQAELTQGEDRFASDRIVYNRATERVTAGSSAQGRERVKIRIEPKGK